MPIFKKENDKLVQIQKINVDKERFLQKLIENNLLEVLDMYFLASEYVTTTGGRIDTLAVDTNGAPVIIEYKLNKNENVINQALSYLKWLKQQKKEFFEMLLIKKLGNDFVNKLDWNNPRVICIAENYSRFDLDTIFFINERIELFKYIYYENEILHLEPLNPSEKTIKSNNDEPKIENEKNETTINEHLEKATSEIKTLFGDLRLRILELDSEIVEKPNKNYIAFRLSKTFVETHILKDQIKLYLRPIEYQDLNKKVEKMPDSYNWTLDRRVYLKNLNELDYIMQLIEQSYNDVL